LKGPGNTLYLDTLYFGSGVGSKVFIQLNRVRVLIRPGGQSQVLGPGFLCDDVEV
jgi:hypothetical protein